MLAFKRQGIDPSEIHYKAKEVIMKEKLLKKSK